MKNLMESALCENPAKFVWKGEVFSGSNEVNTDVVKNDYKNLEDLNIEDCKSAKVREANDNKIDPDVDEDFIKQIEDQETPKFKSKIDKNIFENNKDYKIALGIEKALFRFNQGKESYVSIGQDEYVLKSYKGIIGIYIPTSSVKGYNDGPLFTLSNLSFDETGGAHIKEYFPHLFDNPEKDLSDGDNMLYKHKKDKYEKDIMSIISRIEKNMN